MNVFSWGILASISGGSEGQVQPENPTDSITSLGDRGSSAYLTFLCVLRHCSDSYQDVTGECTHDVSRLRTAYEFCVLCEKLDIWSAWVAYWVA